MSVVLSGLILLLIVLLFGICKDGNKVNNYCAKYVVINVLCIAAVYYWIYKEKQKQKENYVVRYNVKDISTSLF